MDNFREVRRSETKALTFLLLYVAVFALCLIGATEAWSAETPEFVNNPNGTTTVQRVMHETIGTIPPRPPNLSAEDAWALMNQEKDQIIQTAEGGNNLDFLTFPWTISSLITNTTITFQNGEFQSVQSQYTLSNGWVALLAMSLFLVLPYLAFYRTRVLPFSKKHRLFLFSILLFFPPLCGFLMLKLTYGHQASDFIPVPMMLAIVIASMILSHLMKRFRNPHIDYNEPASPLMAMILSVGFSVVISTDNGYDGRYTTGIYDILVYFLWLLGMAVLAYLTAPWIKRFFSLFKTAKVQAVETA